MGQATSAVISYDTSGFSKGREVVPSVSNDRYQQQLRGKIYGAELEVRISGVRRDADIEDPFWDALASGSFLTYQAAGKAPASLGLNGAGQVVRKFVADCEAIFRRNSTAANIAQPQKTEPEMPQSQMPGPWMPRPQSSGGTDWLSPDTRAREARDRADVHHSVQRGLGRFLRHRDGQLLAPL